MTAATRPGNDGLQGLDDSPDDRHADTETTSADPRQRRSRVGDAVLPIVVFFGFIGLWYAITYLVLAVNRRFLLPPPHDVIAEGFANPARGDILTGMWLTAQVALVGLLIAFVIGFSVAVLMSQAKWVERSLYPWAVFSQTVPILALVPLLGFWFGFGWSSRVIVCVVIALFPIIINTLEGLNSADRRLHDLLTLKHASRWTRLVRLQIPAALPDIFVGLRTSAGLAVIGAIVGDFFFGKGEPGLGLLISRYSSRLQSEEMLATTGAACLLGILVFAGFGWLGRRITGKWDDSWSERDQH